MECSGTENRVSDAELSGSENRVSDAELSGSENRVSDAELSVYLSGSENIVIDAESTDKMLTRFNRDHKIRRGWGEYGNGRADSLPPSLPPSPPPRISILPPGLENAGYDDVAELMSLPPSLPPSPPPSPPPRISILPPGLEDAGYDDDAELMDGHALYNTRLAESEEESVPEHQALFDAVRRGDWDEANRLLTLDDNAIIATDSWGTALHNATRFGHEKIVEKLVQKMSDEQLAIQNKRGWTALAYAVREREDIKMVECMVTKNKNLLGIAVESLQQTPITIAALNDQWDIVRYLYSRYLPEDLRLDDVIYGSKLVRYCLYAKQFDIAWELLQRYPQFTCTRDTISPIIAFASLSSAFPSGTPLKFWQRWIYNRICIELDHSVNDFRVNVQNQENEQGNQRNNTVLGLLQGLPSRLLEFLGINRIRELKLIHVRSCQILDCMCDVIKRSTRKEMEDSDVYGAIFVAVENGIVEVVTSLCKARPELLLSPNRDRKNIFQYAVECRQEKVYSLIYGVRQRNRITALLDNSRNNILHCAGLLSPLAKLDRIAGAALQMQRERQWYKEVESIYFRLSGSSTKNKDGMTPPELFTETHKKLHEEGQKWMKETASSCTVVSALIITIMFAVAFTVPGGNNQETGFPIFIDKKLFMVFIISDAISLFSSATSVLMFLGILTSRYAEDDFLKSLPTKMIIGLSTLFISIATMMVAFSSALFIMLRDKPWITYPIIFLAGVPVILFVWLQFPLLIDIFMSTYGGGIFDRKVKRWINS